MWKLVIEDDEGKRTVVPLTRDLYSIGRQEGNTIRLTERNVSREHALLRMRAMPGERPTYLVEDLSSYNGVFVNGLRVGEPQDLAHGDLVQIGDYRIFLQDELLADAADALPIATSDGKQTMPSAPTARASALLDRPNRLVMLAGPVPGSEYPLDRERLTIGRAEDAAISVNHNSVSRMHCEVHALGDGRFEIVDKGSSNGVRVNGADLKRGIIESGDVIELGDVRFKFVGAGQIFLAAESLPLASVGDRPPRDGSHRANVLPTVTFVVLVVAGTASAWVYTRHQGEPRMPATITSPSPEHAAIERAKRLCASGDCEGAHRTLATLPTSSPLRETPEFKNVENQWADELLAQAEHEPDIGAKRALYQRVAQAITVAPMRRKAGADKLLMLDETPATAAPLPPAAAAPDAPDAAAALPARPDVGRRPRGLESIASPPAAAFQPTPTSTPSPRPSSASVDDRERQLALQGTPDAKILLKQQLEQRVYSGRASDTELRLLISTCKDLGDKGCVQQARAIQAQKQN